MSNNIAHRITTYIIQYWAKTTYVKNLTAKITFYDSKGRYVGAAEFYKSRSFPDSSGHLGTSPKRVTLRMHEDKLNTTLALLRNSRYCMLMWVSGTPAKPHPQAYLFASPTARNIIK